MKENVKTCDGCKYDQRSSLSRPCVYCVRNVYHMPKAMDHYKPIIPEMDPEWLYGDDLEEAMA